MDRVRRAALIARLVEQLRSAGSWCGETHVQKAAYFLQYLLSVPLKCEFVLYKHGPFSFDLRDELTGLRADGILTLEPQYPYGPKIASTERGKYIQSVYSKTLSKYEGDINFVAERLGNRDVADLERLATALFVSQKTSGNTTAENRALMLAKLKPHIAKDAAMEAIVELDVMLAEAASSDRGKCA